MKVGDLVKLKSEYTFLSEEENVYYLHGVITMVEEYDRSGLWYEVQWSSERLWHRPNDLELLNESR